MSVRFKRIIAFFMDWMIILFFVVPIFVFLISSFRQGSEIHPFLFLLSFLTVVFALGIVVLRDVIFKGRSLGKRIFGLYVYDKSSLKKADIRQCFIRNIFFFFYFIDGILLLITGETIGDRVAGTLVMPEQRPESQESDTQPIHLAQNKRKTIWIIATIVACLSIVLGLIQLTLNAQKNTEEYKAAYSYFVESRAFEELNVDESKIRLNKYSFYTYTSQDSGSVSKTVEIGFIVNFRSFEVVCHRENDIWQVCSECTLFE